jgi:hypothetical protein
MRRVMLASAILFLATGAALADRPVTDAERARLVEAVAAQGCSGGKMEFDTSNTPAGSTQNGKFEVDDAICADGKKYDLDFDQAFKLLKKKLEN